MSKYFSRSCPKCRAIFRIVVSNPLGKALELPVNGFCAACGYQLRGWKLIIGRTHKGAIYSPRMPKVFR